MTYNTELWYGDDGLIAPPAIEIRMPRSNKGDLIATISRTRAMQDLHELTLAISQHDEWLKMAGTNPNMKDDLDISNDPTIQAVHAALLAFTAVLSPSTTDPKDYIKDLLNGLIYYHYQGGIDNQGGGDMNTPCLDLLNTASRQWAQLYAEDSDATTILAVEAYEMVREDKDYWEFSYHANCIRQPKTYTHGLAYNDRPIFLITHGETDDYRLYFDPEEICDHDEVHKNTPIRMKNPAGDGAFPDINEPYDEDRPDDYIDYTGKWP